MDESTQAPSAVTEASVDSSPVSEGTTPEPTSTPVPAVPNPAESPNQPEPTGPAPETPMPDQPDHGINPDKGIDPDAGDLPTDPDHNTAGEPTDNAGPDLRSMSRADRAQYFKELGDRQKQAVETSIDAAYQPQDFDGLKQAYLDDGHTEAEATLLARDDVRTQREQLNEARGEIAELNAGLVVDAFQAVQTMDWLNKDKPDSYDEGAATAVANAYESLCISRDPRTNQIVESRMPFSQFAALFDSNRQSASEKAKVSAQRAAEQQMAAVAPSASTTQTRATSFENMTLDQQREHLRAQGHYVT